MLGENTSLLVLDLSRNHLGKSAASRIAVGLERNRNLTTLKLGWNNLERWVGDFQLPGVSWVPCRKMTFR